MLRTVPSRGSRNDERNDDEGNDKGNDELVKNTDEDSKQLV